MEIALIFGLFLILLTVGVPVAFSLMVSSLAGLMLLKGTGTAFGYLSFVPFATMYNFLFIAVPLFIVMAEIITYSGLGSGIYELMSRLLARLPGSLASATVAACAIFGAVQGFSVATCATVGPVAIPEMLKRGYNRSLALGSVGAGGALGSLIPPSVPVVLYCIVAEESIGKVLLACLIPGYMLASLFMGYITLRVVKNPTLAPRFNASASEGDAPQKKRIPLNELVATGLVIIMIVLVLGGIYTGITTPTEAAAVGAVSAIAISFGMLRRRGVRPFGQALVAAAEMTAMAAFLLVGATLFTYFVTGTGLPAKITGLIVSMGLSKWWVLVAANLIWLLLGCFLDVSSIIFITIPILMPVLTTMGFDKVWLGAVLMMNLEAAVITPPFGFNIFVLQGIMKDPDVYGDIIRGVFPFVGVIVLGIVLLVVFPQLALWLPSTMMTK